MTPTDASPATLVVTQLRFEHARAAFGIGVARPRLSWRVETNTPEWLQSAWQLELQAVDGSPRADSGRVASGDSVLVAWPFAALQSRERVSLRLRVWGVDGSASAWSAPFALEIGLLSPEDWTAQFIAPAWDDDGSQPQPVPLLRRDFEIKPGLQSARLYVTALGVYQAQINGHDVGDELLAPGWTSYAHQLHAQTHDVTALLKPGPNAIGALLGDGWYRGWLGFNGGRRNIYGNRSALLAQLELAYADGSRERVVSDSSWRASTGALLLSGIYEGETHDARLARDGWSTSGHPDHDWSAVQIVQRTFASLTSPPLPPVRRIETCKPLSIFTSPSGKTLVDFGQNLVGRLRIRVHGEAGQTITLRHAEVLEHGELGTRPLRRAQATDRYTLRGGAGETWEPLFTFHGFRYAEVSGWPGTLQAEDLEAVVIHTDMERNGWFECSEPMVNKLHENIVWSMRGNFLSIPTDCPQRDERLGWTGDIQVFAPTAAFLYHVPGFLQSWLGDLAAEQKTFDGIVPMVVPNILDWPTKAVAAWGDAAAIVPWVLYQRYGDVEILRAQFDSMRAWVEWVKAASGPGLLWNQGLQLGDWLDPAAPPNRPSKAQTDRYLVASAYFARSTEVTGLAAGVLGMVQEEAHYLKLAADIRAAFADEYITPNGRMTSDAQTAYALAIEFGLMPSAAQRQAAGRRLATVVRDNGFRIGTGFVGTPLICDALSSVGDDATAYAMLMETECPSWLYPVGIGATTVWERWDSMLPDGSINPGEMTSFNHYALGAVADWLHRVVAGLAPAAPGYRRITFAPRPGGGLTRASARHISAYGLIESKWTLTEGRFELTVTVPPNTRATVNFPGSDRAPLDVGSGTHTWSYVYAAAAAHAQLSVDSTLGQIKSVPRAWGWLAKSLPGLLHDFIMSQTVLQDDDRVTLRHALTPARKRVEAIAAITDMFKTL